MEEKKFGLIPGVVCTLKKTEPSIIDAISKKTGIPADRVKKMMLYNILTINQFSQLSEMPISTVTNKTRPAFVGETINTELDWCFPFSDKDNEGPKFILRNEKSEKFLKA